MGVITDLLTAQIEQLTAQLDESQRRRQALLEDVKAHLAEIDDLTPVDAD